MDLDEARAVVREQHRAVLATIRGDGTPQMSPVLVAVDDEGRVLVSTREGALKVRNLRRDPRVCVVVETSGPGGDDGGGVIVRGRVEFLADGPERRALAERFHDKYPRLQRLWNGRAMPANRVMFRIAPARVTSWGLG